MPRLDAIANAPRLARWTNSTRGGLWRHRRDLLLVIILASAFWVLASRVDQATPHFEGAEEPWYVARAMGVIDTLPAFAEEETRTEVADSWRPSSQPPLYQWLSRALVAQLDPAGIWYVPNPFAAPWAQEPSSLNAVLHGSETFVAPDDVVLAVARLRHLSLVAGLVAMALVYVIARLLLPAARWRPLLTAAMVGLNPFFLATSAQANSHALMIALATLSLLVSLLVSRGWRTWVSAVTLGIVCGLSALTSRLGATAVVLIPLAWLGSARSEPRYQSRAHALLSLLCMVLCAGWWYVTWAVSPRPAATSSLLSAPIATIAMSYLQAWGRFGWLGIGVEPAYQGWIGVVSVVIAALGLLRLGNAIWEGRALDSWRRWRIPFLWGTTMGIVALLVGSTGSSRAPFAWLLALPPLVLVALGAGLPQLPGSAKGVLALVGLAPLVATAWVAPAAYIASAYTPPARIALADVPLDIRDVAIAFDETLYLLGYQAPLEVDPKSETYDITLYWLCTDAPDTDYVHSLTVLGPEGRIFGRVETLPASGTYPTSLWQPAEVIVERYQLRLKRNDAQPVAASLRVAVRRLDDGSAARAADSHGNQLESSAAIGDVRVPPATTSRETPSHRVDVRFGDVVTLAGYDSYPLQPTSGQLWNVTLHWHVRHLMLGDWTIFVHLVDQDGDLIAQGDSQPLRGTLPTSFWRQGDRLLDLHTLPIPNHLPAEPLYLRVGFYQIDSGERLPVSGTDTAAEQDYVEIGPITLLGEPPRP